jgi:hypothetical protein
MADSEGCGRREPEGVPLTPLGPDSLALLTTSGVSPFASQGGETAGLMLRFVARASGVGVGVGSAGFCADAIGASAVSVASSMVLRNLTAVLASALYYALAAV